MSYTKEQINKILTSEYNSREWKKFLATVFPNSEFLLNPNPLTDLKSPQVNSADSIGNVILDENGIERKIGFYEVKLGERVILERNRVTLRNLLKNYWKNLDGAFIAYVQPSSRIWRFTFVSELTGFDTDGYYTELKTDPKRFTYVFGEGESCRTATERFEILLSNGKNNTLETVKEAFSVEKLSKSFFDNYKTQYDSFCNYLFSKHSIFKSKFNGDKKGVRDFVKILLGRITFLYFIQKKGWLGVSANGNWGDGDRTFLQNMFQRYKHKTLFYQDILTKLFFDTLNTKRENDLIELIQGERIKIPYLNGGLFEEKDRNLREIIFNENLFRDLFNFFDQYNFTIYEDDPQDHTVAVDPEMLGHIFENLLEDNKDKGTFYTPKVVVHYMCQESLIEYISTYFASRGYKVIDDKLNGNSSNLEDDQNQLIINRRIIENLIKKDLKDSDTATIFSFIQELNSALNEVKICDPAIGSGAFPMGLLQEIFSAKQTLWYLEKGNLEEFPASKIKLDIIENSIYGVDIEKGAVDIARLRFWLSLVVDETKPNPLPNLDYKIVVGNSLVSKFKDIVIELNWDIDVTSAGLFGQKTLIKNNQILSELIKRQKEYFNTGLYKLELAEKIKKLKIQLLINYFEHKIISNGLDKIPQRNAFRNNKEFIYQMNIFLQTRKWKENIQILAELSKSNLSQFEFFDWKLDFPEIFMNEFLDNPGFDIVIGNPPYIKEYTNKKAFDGFHSSPYYKGKMDIWYGFACKTLDFLKSGGIQCFIAQNNWITSTGAIKLREKIISECSLKMFTDFGDYKVFESSGIQTMIYLVKNQASLSVDYIRYSLLKNPNINISELLTFLNFDYKDSNSIKYIFEFNHVNHVNHANLTIHFNTHQVAKLLEKIEKKRNFSFHKNEIAQGIVLPQDFVIQKTKVRLEKDVQIGDGIFILSNNEKHNLNLSKSELALLKPYYTTNELQKYFGNAENQYWVIYTNSKFKDPSVIKDYPKIKAHLDRFSTIITSDNGPYGLHRARNDEFFIGEKIISLRKCPHIPVFTYTEFDCYVSETFYVLKTTRLDQKYLTGFLNSKLIAFWLRYKGKMQGSNFQIDKEPLLNLPIFQTDQKVTGKISHIVEEIHKNKAQGQETTILENQIDQLIYSFFELTEDEIYFIESDYNSY